MKPDNVQTRVLIAEDTVVGRKVVARILSEAGFEVDAVENGLGVLDLLAATRYDMLIMDCMMPEMDGFATARAIRSGSAGEACSGIPIIAISGLASEEDRQVCLEAGMNDLVQKPITHDNLLPVIHSVLAGSQGGGTNPAPTEPDAAENLLQSLDDWSPGFMDKIIDQFLDDVPGDIEVITSAMDAGNLEELRSLAHRLRGSADVLSAAALSTRASALEKACLQNQPAEARELGQALILELRALLSAHE